MSRYKVFLSALKCMLGFHAWEQTHALTPEGEKKFKQPPTNENCARCGIYRQPPALKEIRDERGELRWAEVSDAFEVLARGSCGKCHGRGAHRRMLLPAEDGFKVTALLPCECLRIQPRFVKREKLPGQ